MTSNTNILARDVNNNLLNDSTNRKKLAMKTRNILFTGILISLTGCVTPYQETDSNGGVSGIPLNETVYDIRASGNGYTSASISKDHALLKSAELCKKNGFTHFIPVSQIQFSTQQTIPNNIYHTNCYGNSCFTTGGGYTTTTRPQYNMTIKLLGENDEIPTIAYSCSVIYDSLAPKYIK